MIARHQGIVLQHRPEVQSSRIGNDPSGILVGGQDLLSELVEAVPVRTDDLDLAVLGTTHCPIA